MYFAEFNDSFPPQTDGVAQTIRNYALWLNRKHAPTCVVTPQFPTACDHEEFPVFRFASMPLFVEKDYNLGLPEIAFRTFRRLDTLPLTLLHAHCPFASGTLALMTARRKNVPLVATFHSKFADDFAQRLKMENAGRIAAMYTAKFFSQVDEVWAVNRSSAQTLQEYGYRGPVTVMPNGCDFEPKERTAENRRTILRKFRLPDKPLVLFVGRLVEQKNPAFLLRSFGRMANGDCSLLFVGGGEGQPAYEKLARDLGIAGRVRFAGAIRDRALLQSIYAAADLFVLPSVYDTDGLVKREAASCGCPSLLIAGSNAAEGIVDGENGFTAELDETAYARSLDAILSNTDLIRKAGEEARRTVYVSWESIVDRVAGEYARVVSQYREKKARKGAHRKYYSIPVVIAQDLINKQALRIKFTTRKLDRQAKHRSATIQKQNLQKFKELRSRILETRRMRDL